jgi:hypothetical protein
MPGVRVQHPTARNVRYTVEELNTFYPPPGYLCTPPELGGCGRLHERKAHHLNLDETGAAIISAGVIARIGARLALDGFSVTNVVADPPAIGVGLNPNAPGATPGIEIIRSPSDPS